MQTKGFFSFPKFLTLAVLCAIVGIILYMTVTPPVSVRYEGPVASPSISPSPSTVATSKPVVTPKASTPVTVASPTVLTADVKVVDENNGTTVRMRAGQTLALVLHSTYWKIDRINNLSVLKPVGEPVYKSSPPGSAGCVPGQGCGTVTQKFTALQLGTVMITASRTTCGEALACSPEQRSFSVVVAIQ